MSATSHIKYHFLSQEFYICYKAIVSSFPQIVDKFNVKYTLVCKSIEYLLKSLLLFGGKSKQELKNDYGHDLETLLSAVIDTGIDKQLNVNFADEFKSALVSLNAYYKSKDFEYPNTGTKTVTLYIQLNEPIEILLAKMEEFYRSDLRHTRIAKDTK